MKRIKIIYKVFLAFVLFVVMSTSCNQHSSFDMIISFYVINETSQDVLYNNEILMLSGEKKQIIKKHVDAYSDVYPESMVFASFTFGNSVSVQYSPFDTFSRNIYRNYEVEEKKLSHHCNKMEMSYLYRLTEEDYQNALRQSQR